MDITAFLQTYGSLLISIISLLLSGGALYVTSRVAKTDRLNTNTWATYEAYNSERVRAGRAAARAAMKAHPQGFASLEDYEHHFLHSASTPKHAQELREQEQHLHDLMAFYHQVGLLLKKRLVDRDFTLLMLGAGLDDRWTLLSKIPPLFEDHSKPDGDFPYGGMYFLHEAFLDWQAKRFVGLKQEFKQALVRTQGRAKSEAESGSQEALATVVSQPPGITNEGH